MKQFQYKQNKFEKNILMVNKANLAREKILNNWKTKKLFNILLSFENKVKLNFHYS